MHSTTVCKINKRCHVNIMYSVDKDIETVLRPVNIMQTIFFCPKYRIKDNTIYPNSLLSNILSISGTMCLIFIVLYRLHQLSSYEDFVQYLIFVYLAACCDICFYAVGFLLNCFLTIVQVPKNIKFVLTIQSIHRFLNNKRYLRTFSVVNCLIALWIFLTFTCLICFFNLATNFGLVAFTYVSFDVNVIYATRCITVLKDMLDLWIEEVLYPLLIRDMDMKHYCQVMFQRYADILNAYDTFKSTFKYFVSNCTV